MGADLHFAIEKSYPTKLTYADIVIKELEIWIVKYDLAGYDPSRQASDFQKDTDRIYRLLRGWKEYDKDGPGEPGIPIEFRKDNHV